MGLTETTVAAVGTGTVAAVATMTEVDMAMDLHHRLLTKTITGEVVVVVARLVALTLVGVATPSRVVVRPTTLGMVDAIWQTCVAAVQ